MSSFENHFNQETPVEFQTMSWSDVLQSSNAILELIGQDEYLPDLGSGDYSGQVAEWTSEKHQRTIYLRRTQVESGFCYSLHAQLLEDNEATIYDYSSDKPGIYKMPNDDDEDYPKAEKTPELQIRLHKDFEDYLKSAPINFEAHSTAYEILEFEDIVERYLGDVAESDEKIKSFLMTRLFGSEIEWETADYNELMRKVKEEYHVSGAEAKRIYEIAREKTERKIKHGEA